MGLLGYRLDRHRLKKKGDRSVIVFSLVIFAVRIATAIAGNSLALVGDITAPANLGDTIPSSKEEINMIGLAGVILIIIGVLATTVWQLWGKPASEKKSEKKGEQSVECNHFTQFVTIADFTKKFDAIDARFLRLEEGIVEGIEQQRDRTEKYLHDMRHEIRDELQALKSSTELQASEARSLTESANKVSEERSIENHKRTNDLVSAVGELRGELKLISQMLMRKKP